jgi:hypothetical protein
MNRLFAVQQKSNIYVSRNLNITLSKLLRDDVKTRAAFLTINR